MRVTSRFASLGIVAVVLAATSVGVRANDDSARGRATDTIKSRPATALNDTQKYRPKLGCFAAGTRDPSGNAQLVC